MKKFLLVWGLLWIVLPHQLENRYLKVVQYGVHDGKLKVAYVVKDTSWSVRLWVAGEDDYGYYVRTTFCDIVPVSSRRGSYEEAFCVVPSDMVKVKLSF